MRTVTKAVIPAAGWGTRMLPATKNQPKEMLPIIDTPTIQYVVEEAISSGIHDILIVTGKGKGSMEDHFDRNFELERLLKEKKDEKRMKDIKKIGNYSDIITYVRQKERKGLADAISCAKKYIMDDNFAVLLGDDIITNSKAPCTKQLMNVFEKYGSPVIGIEYTTKHRKYGMIKPEKVDERLYRVKEIVEKPRTWNDPSSLGVIGRYVMTPDIFECIEKTEPGYGGEIQFTDAIRKLGERRQIYAYEFDGKRYDVGDPLGIVKATTEFALDRKDIGKDTEVWIRNLAKELDI